MSARCEFAAEATVTVRTWQGTDIRLTYQIVRPPVKARRAAPVVLIQGLGEQLLGWDDAFCEVLASRLSTDVIRFDNRDVGHSTKLDDPAPGDYTVADMADDAAALMERLGIRAGAHIVGSSMGGMIAQEMLLRHRSQVLSCAVVMSAGEPAGGGAVKPTKRVAKVFYQKPKGTDAKAIADYRMLVWENIFVPEGRWDDGLKQLAAAESKRVAERSAYFGGIARQFMAIASSPSRLEDLRALKAPPPTVVIHGSEDGLLLPIEGKAVADAIPNATWTPIPGMAHRILPGHYAVVAQAIIDNAAKAPSGLKAKL